MTVKLNKQYQPEANWKTLVLVEGNETREEVSFELCVRRPTFDEQIVAQADQALHQLELVGQPDKAQRRQNIIAHQRSRISKTITDWRGVADDNGPVPFSLDMLELLCSQYPQALRSLNIIIDDVLVTYPGDLEKNSPPPPADGGTATSDAITASMGSSESGTGSSTASD